MALAQRTVADVCLAARDASRVLAGLDTDTRDAALLAIADALIAREGEILEANAADLVAGRENGLSPALLDRLALDPARLAAIADGTRAIAALPDPVGEVVEGRRLPNGLDVRKVRVPFGVVAVVCDALQRRAVLRCRRRHRLRRHPAGRDRPRGRRWARGTARARDPGRRRR